MPRQVMTKSIGGALLAAAFVTTTAERATAGLNDLIIGGGAAVIIGCATGAINCNKNKKRKAAPRSSANTAARQANREVQSALNGFGWNVGGVDGVMGKRSRGAIRDYQGYMGYPQTGQLSDWERQNLVDGWAAYQRGEGARYPNTMRAEGPRGMLNTMRDPNYASKYGDTVNPNYGNNGYGQTPNYNQNQAGLQNNGTNWNNNQQAVQPTQPLNQAPQPAGQVIGGGDAAKPGALPSLKPLKPLGQVAVSAAARCELVDQTTRIQGGVIRAANMTDPNQALSEKFCEARGFAITQGGSVAS
ncbi:MAG: peptidoglycan-binding domain-containing protein, partial [Pseudomonadota bacterium]